MSPATVQVVRALAATLAVQSMVTMATLTVPVFATEAAGDIGVSAANIGIFASLIYAGAMTASLVSGGVAASALLLYLPADIDVVTGDAKLRVEAVDCFQYIFAKGHIAARDMFGHGVGDQYVGRVTRRLGYTVGYRTIAKRCHVRSSDAGKSMLIEGSCQVLEPVRIWARIVVQVSNNIAGCGCQTGV